MTTYTGVFGADVIPPSEYSYAAVSLTANTTFEWPQLATSANLIANLMEVTPTAASSFTLTMPAANQVSTAMPVLMRNMGSATFTVADSAGGTITTIAAGVSKLIYITSNATAAGTWANLTYGTGTSAADAATLEGLGNKAIGATLNSKIAVTTKSATWTVAAADRAGLFAVTSGTFSVVLPPAATMATDFYVMIRNSGTGTVTIDPDSSELIDGATTLQLAPNESAFIVCSGAAWYSIGYGRSTQFQFTKLVKNIAGAGATFTLTSAEASNKLMQFTGAVTGNNTIVVPDVVAVYYLQNDYTGTAETLTIKTASGTGLATDINSRTIVYCDGVNVTLAQTSAAPSSSLAGGTAGALVYQTGSGTTGFSAASSAAGALVLANAAAAAPTFVNDVATGQVLVSGGVGSPPAYSATPTVTSLNKVTITAPATGSTLTIANGKTLTASNSITLAGTDSTIMTFPSTSAAIARVDGANTFTGDQTYAENAGIVLDAALSADGKYCGIVEAGTSSAALAFGEICYRVTATGKWALAKADAASTSINELGVCVLAAAGADAATTMLLFGKVRADALFDTFTVGAPIYISAATAGKSVSTAPTGTVDFVVRKIGSAEDANTIFFRPSNDYVTIDASSTLKSVGGVTVAASSMTLGTATATTSGTATDFTSIPSGTKMIIVSLASFSTNGTAGYLLQLGVSGTPETSGYLCAGSILSTGVSTSNYTAGFGIPTSSAAEVHHGSYILTLLDSSTNTWACTSVTAQSDAARSYTLGGSKSLAGVLNMIRFTTTTGADTFDGGKINIAYLG